MIKQRRTETRRPAVRRYLLLAIPFAALSPGGGVHAQDLPNVGGIVRSAIENPVTFSGEIGTYGELYGISGRTNRRPSGTARLYFRPTMTLFDEMTLSFNFLLSTEGRALEQRLGYRQINQLGIRPQWGWGYANAGDFSERFTPASLDGVMIRGGSISINPGLLRFSALGGYTRRTGNGEGSFDRYLYGARLGIGREGGSFVDLLFLRVRDIPSRFQTIVPDSLPARDSTQVGNNISPYQETPQENLVAGLTGAISFLSNAVSMSGELLGSAFTRDMGASQISESRVPAFARKLYSPRLSSNVDYAYNLHLKVTLRSVGFHAGYRYVGPGYNSLGVVSLMNDQRELVLGSSVRFHRWSAGLVWSRQNDNLLSQKLYTTVRQKFSGTAGLRPLENWNVALTGTMLTMRNSASSDTTKIKFQMLSVGATQSVSFGRENIFRNVSVTYLFQKSLDENPFRSTNGFRSHTVTGGAAAVLAEDFSVLPSFSFVATRPGVQPWAGIQYYSLTPRYQLLDDRLESSLTLSFSRGQSGRSLQLSINGRYRLTPATTVTLLIRTTGFRAALSGSGDYTENTANLSITQRL